MTPKQTRRLELLKEKIKQLEMYQDTKMPPSKAKTVKRLIKFYCKKLACI